jgi:DNA invertase Pin-like site-specific DNA recombinase
MDLSGYPPRKRVLCRIRKVACFPARPHNRAVKYGYARTSTGDQTTALQLAALKRARCSHIFEDRGQSGSTPKRPALTRCLKTLRAGDTLVVWKLDRLGRSLRDLIILLDSLNERGVRFQSLTEAIDTETPTGRAMWQMIGVLAELERSLIVERTRAGMQAARRRGVKFGRKRKLSAAQIEHARKLIGQGESRQYVADLLSVGRVTLYRALLG